MLPAPTAAFDPDVSVQGPTVTLTGTAAAATGASLTGVELFEGTTDLGAATLAADGTWSFGFAQGPGFHTGITAVATDSQGLTGSAPSHYDLTTGVRGEPYTTVLDSYDPATSDYEGSTYFKRGGRVYLENSYASDANGGSTFTYADGSFFNDKPYSSFVDSYDADGNILQHVENNDDGSHLISGLANGQTLVGLGNDTFVDNAAAEHFILGAGVGTETITDFQASGRGHDFISLPAFARGRLDQILANAQEDGQGDTTLRFGRNDSVTFQGVSAADLENNKQTLFSFHAAPV